MKNTPDGKKTRKERRKILNMLSLIYNKGGNQKQCLISSLMLLSIVNSTLFFHLTLFPAQI
jgi:hypothetical protein